MIATSARGFSPNLDDLSAGATRAWRDRILGGDGIVHFPIRHHSPACALHLARGLAELRPATIVLEMPADFADLVPLVLDAATRPPVAIVSIVVDEGGKDQPAVAGYWPLSAASPEVVALRHAAAHDARLVLADLPSGARLQAQPDDGTPPTSVKPVPLTDERPLAYSDYARALVARLGCRDFDEAWDRLFESRALEADWRAFFGDLGVHCALARAASRDTTDAEHDLRLAREAAMRAALREAAGSAGGAPIAVITGGFHTPALLDLAGAPATADRRTKARPAKAYLVRYDHRHLDALNGYAAGMPSPRYYERLHRAVAEGGDAPFMAVAQDVLSDLCARLRRGPHVVAPALPTLVAALAHARDLAALRDLPGPGRAEILDAARACFIKDEDTRFGSRLLETLHRELTGEAIGDVPPSAGSPPLVEAARVRARALGFSVDDGLERKRELDIHRKPRHRAASRFLHVMDLLETDFGRKIKGPDFRQGVNTGALFETWSCAWSPRVEGKLVALAGEGADLERAGIAALRRRVAALQADCAACDSRAVADLVTIAAQAGLAESIGALAALLGRTIALDTRFARVVDCLGTLDGLSRGRRVLGLTGASVLTPLLAACYRRAIDLLPHVATGTGEAVAADAQALAALHHMCAPLIAPDAAGAVPFDRELLDDGVAALLATDLPPLVLGVVAASAHLAGRLGERELARILCGMLGGGREPEQRCAPLAGLIMVQPALLRRRGNILAGIDEVFATLDETTFLDMLPHLRLALAGLDPHETEDLAARIAEMKNLSGSLPLPPIPMTAAEVVANARQAQALTTLLETDGLAAWFGDAPLAPDRVSDRDGPELSA